MFSYLEMNEMLPDARKVNRQCSTMKERPQWPVNSGGLMDPDIEGPKVGIGEGVGVRTIPAG